MKVEYHLTTKRVVNAHVVLPDRADVSDMGMVLSRGVWFPHTLRVHIQTTRCCQELSLGDSWLTDPRLARFVALEGSVFETCCLACGQTKSMESCDVSLLHWRSFEEVRWWLGLPWFTEAMAGSTVTLRDGQEQEWHDGIQVSDLKNDAPTAPLPLSEERVEQCKQALLNVIQLVRQCVHPRLYSTMENFYTEGKVYVAFRQKKREGFFFMVKTKPNCLAWPREYIGSEDRHLVRAAVRCLPAMTLAQFMQSVVQVITVGECEFLIIVNWSIGDIVLRRHDYRWVHENHVQKVHGFKYKHPLLHLAFGTTRSWTLYHGTSMPCGQKVMESGFKVVPFHTCQGLYYKCRPPYACGCKGMVGPGVYLAGFDKAAANAGRASGALKPGMVLECRVVTGEVKVVTPWSMEFCHCGCDSMFSDHVAHWYHEEMFDSLLLCKGAGVKRDELCVRKPRRVQPRSTTYVMFNGNRERIYCSLYKPNL